MTAIRKVAAVVRLGLYAPESYFKKHELPLDAAALKDHRFVSYIGDLVQVDAIRWLDDVIKDPDVCFYSNSMFAQMRAGSGPSPRFSNRRSTPIPPCKWRALCTLIDEARPIIYNGGVIGIAAKNMVWDKTSLPSRRRRAKSKDRPSEAG
jgi:hypothetical protein